MTLLLSMLLADGLVTLRTPLTADLGAVGLEDPLFLRRAKNFSFLSKFSGLDQHSFSEWGPTHSVSVHLEPEVLLKLEVMETEWNCMIEFEVQ